MALVIGRVGYRNAQYVYIVYDTYDSITNMSTTYLFVVICNQPDIPSVQHFISISILGICTSEDRAYFQHLEIF